MTIYSISMFFISVLGFLVLTPFALVLVHKHSGWDKSTKWQATFVWVITAVCVVFSSAASLLELDSHAYASKPVLYLYPESKTKVSVELSKPENITCDYPEYSDGWNVIAKPNGDLKDLQSSRDLYCLYYESEMQDVKVEKEGFVVKSADIADFLDEKLKILGLNDKERNEFIIYWLPRLEESEYNYIRFLTEEEIDNIQGLNINPKPDTTIRVMMSYKGLEKPIPVREQKLKSAERAGFTVVEWGGTEIR